MSPLSLIDIHLSVITQSAPSAASKGSSVIKSLQLFFFASLTIFLFGWYFFGQAILSSNLNLVAASIKEFDTLFPSPSHAIVFPFISPLASSKVKMSAIIWHG